MDPFYFDFRAEVKQALEKNNSLLLEIEKKETVIQLTLEQNAEAVNAVTDLREYASRIGIQTMLVEIDEIKTECYDVRDRLLAYLAQYN